ncbi:MAG: NAD(P)/FAD-dependent oxidoreductase, partial [Oscillospiraceae bacterium]|nr:NAD(P)/FAD-dependent oxidoreductase [Oscillospiraceae bacterium]
PIRSDTGILKELKGIRVKGAVTLLDRGRNMQTETGEIQFTEQAVSGICVFNLVSRIELHQKKFADYQLQINLCPELEGAEILSRLYTCQAVRPEADCENMLSGIIRKALARVILKSNRIRPEMPCMNLTDEQLRHLAHALQDFRFPVLGTVHAQAQASAGGVHGSALDENLQVKSHPGLYITGEAVDVYAPCGGYQLHWAWASGYTAAKDCMKKQKNNA